jgi:hypothetical protein
MRSDNSNIVLYPLKMFALVLFFLFLDLLRFQHAPQSRLLSCLVLLDVLQLLTDAEAVQATWWAFQAASWLLPVIPVAQMYLRNL